MAEHSGVTPVRGEPRDRHDSDITLLEVMPSAWATVKAAAGSAVTSSDHREKSMRVYESIATLMQPFCNVLC